MMGSEEDRSGLYISVQPTASPKLQALIHKLLDLIQSLPHHIPSTVPDVWKKRLDVGSLDTTTPDHQVIIAVFRACHTKFGESVTGKGGCRHLLAALPKPSKRDFQLERLLAKLNYLLETVSRDINSTRDVELLRLYYTAGEVLKSTKRMQTSTGSPLTGIGTPLLAGSSSRQASWTDTDAVSSAMEKLDVLPRAVRHLLDGATQEPGVAQYLGALQHSDIQWITSSAPQSFSASTDKDYIRDNFGVVAEGIVLYPPPKTLVKEALRCFTGSAVVHPEAALLGYVCEHKVNIMSGYIGGSELVCYPCFMLLHALNVLAGRRGKRLVGVSQCSFRIPLPWCPPPAMDSRVLEEFRDLLRQDYETTFEQETAKACQWRQLSWGLGQKPGGQKPSSASPSKK